MGTKINVPNVVLVVMDAVRADHLSCYGYRRKTSPNIDCLAKKGVLFERAFSTAEWSYPSHASIFTGKYPSHHSTLGKDIFLHKENTTIAEILSWNGYQTIGLSSNELLSPINGFNKGFQKYFVFDIPPKIRSVFGSIKQSPKDFARTFIYGGDGYTYRNIEKIKGFLKNCRREEPFFLFTNLYNCHAPYNPPRPFKEHFCGSLDRPPFYTMEFIFHMIFGHPGGKIPGFNVQKLNLIASEGGQYSFMAKEFQMSEKEWEVIKSWYDGEILYLDYRIGELIDFLQDREILENTLLIITSDHGENFGEHGLASHQFCLYDTLIHVPLIMVYPDVIPRGRKISSLVSHIDIFPTILNLLNIKGYRHDIQGKSLFPFKDRKIHDFVCAECGESVTSRLVGTWKKYGHKLKPYDKGSKCLRTEDYKYILSADQNEELYDIQKDPLEKVNIANEHPDKTKCFRKQLENAIDISFFGPREFAKQEREKILNKLQALGYI